MDPAVGEVDLRLRVPGRPGAVVEPLVAHVGGRARDAAVGDDRTAGRLSVVDAVHHGLDGGQVGESDARFVSDPDEPCAVWTEAERAKGQAWGVKTVESFHTYGTPVAR
jgi:hypothetical protein